MTTPTYKQSIIVYHKEKEVFYYNYDKESWEFQVKRICDTLDRYNTYIAFTCHHRPGVTKLIKESNIDKIVFWEQHEQE